MKSALLAGLSAAAMLWALSAEGAIVTPPGNDQVPGQQFHITVDSLPLAEDVAPVPAQPPRQIPRGELKPIVPVGFTTTLFISDFGAGRKLAVNPDDGLLFLSQQQASSARGDAGTRSPPTLDRPPHWTCHPVEG